MKPLAVALVGCGDIAFGYDRKLRHEGVHTHCAALAAAERFHLAAVCDVDRGRAEECAHAYGIPVVYDSFEALIAGENPEILVICTPDQTHAALGQAALTISGLRALVVEKPVALTSQDAENFLRTARERNVPVVVNYSRRYAAGLQRLRETIGQEQLRAITGFYTKGIRHNGTHWLDLAEFLGGPIARLSARDALSDNGADPTLDLQLEFSGGASGFVKGCVEQEYSLFEMDILTDRGRYMLTDFGHRLETWRAGESPTRGGYRELIPAGVQSTGLDRALPGLWQDLAGVLDHGRAPLSHGLNAARALYLAERAIQAATDGTAVSVA